MVNGRLLIFLVHLCFDLKGTFCILHAGWQHRVKSQMLKSLQILFICYSTEKEHPPGCCLDTSGYVIEAAPEVACPLSQLIFRTGADPWRNHQSQWKAAVKGSSLGGSKEAAPNGW